MRRLWLIFSQAVTVSLAALFVVATLKPGWLGQNGSQPALVPVLEAPPIRPQSTGLPVATPISYAAAAQKALPSVVHVFTSKEVRQNRNPLADDPLFRHFFGDRDGNRVKRRTSELGSGVIVSANGYILTNNHVVEQADEIAIALYDGRKLPAKIVGRDPESDLAVLRINAESLPAITFGNPETLRVGDVVLAIGNPFGVGQTVTMGIVSALGRSHLGINTFENFIQTDAAINPGNSGGALIDARGNLIGINAAIYSQSGGSLGIGFAIPVSLARNIMEQIIATGSVTRGWIGVEVRDISSEQARTLDLPGGGTLITGVASDSPADRGGVTPGDLLLAINDQPVSDSQKMLSQIAALKPGQRATLAVQRQTHKLEIPIVVGRRPLPTAP